MSSFFASLRAALTSAPSEDVLIEDMSRCSVVADHKPEWTQEFIVNLCVREGTPHWRARRAYCLKHAFTKPTADEQFLLDAILGKK